MKIISYIIFILLVFSNLCFASGVRNIQENYQVVYNILGDYSPRLKPGASTDWIPRDCSPNLKIFREALWSREVSKPQEEQ